MNLITLALIGLLLLPIFWIFIIILVLALRKKEPSAPILAHPALQKQQRYGWEDYLKLAPNEPAKPKARSPVGLILLAVFLLLAGPPLAFVILHYDLGLSLPEISILGNTSEQMNETNATASNFTIPHFLSYNASLVPNFSFSMPDVNATSWIRGRTSSIAPYYFTAVIAILIMSAILAVFIYHLKSRKSVLAKAKKTAKNILADDKPSSLSFLKKYPRPLVVAFASILALALMLLILLFTGLFPGLRDFLGIYRLFIAAGIVLLLILISIIQYFRLRHRN